MRDTIWLPYHEEYQMTAETTRDTIWLPHQESINMAATPREQQYGCRITREPYGCRTTRDTIWLPNDRENKMATEPRVYNMTAEPREIQYGCHNTRDKIWLPNHEGYNMAAALRKKQYGRSSVYPTMQETGRGRGRGSGVVPMVALPVSSLFLSYWSSQLSSAASNPGRDG